MSDFAQFSIAALQVIWINLLLSGDNAVVIAMACRGLNPRERRRGMIIGAGFAAVLLIVFASALTALIALPYLRLASGCALLWIAVKLLTEKPPGEGKESAAVGSLRQAVQIIVVADIIMSLDNVVAVAAVARGRYGLIGLSLAVGIPIVFGGSALVLALLKRFPIIVWAGAALLGFVAGELIADDPALAPWLKGIGIGPPSGPATRHLETLGLTPADVLLGALGAVVVLVAGHVGRGRRTENERQGTDDG
jgi:YjbE family integral membrane protein